MKAALNSYFKISLNKFSRWRTRHISNKNFIIIASIIVGIAAGLAAVILKNLVHLVENFVNSFSQVQYHNYLYFLFPALGILLTVSYVHFFLKGKLGRGISGVIYAASRKDGAMATDKTYTHVITSALTVGFGGSAGLESPIVVTGSAVGSRIGAILRLTSKERILLLACGTCAGVSAIFNSPVAAVIFAVEVLLLEISVPVFIPLLIASATATVVSTLLQSRQLFHLISDGWEFSAIPFYVLLGILCGLISVYITRFTLKTEAWIDAQKGTFTKALVGGLILGAMIFVLPPLYGEGYSTIENLMGGNYQRLLDKSMFYDYRSYSWFVLLFAFVLIFVKVFATSITIACGGNGGIFATSLMIGALSGFFMSHGINALGFIHINETNFVAVGMAGILSGVIHAPLTAIFLIAEITGGYLLIVPLMIVSAISFFTARYFEPYTIYTRKLAEKGLLLQNDKDRVVLSQIAIAQILETDFLPVKAHQCLGEVIPVVSRSRRNIFPVLDEEGRLTGILSLNQIREVMFEIGKYDKIFVNEVMSTGFPVVEIGENMSSVMRKLEDKSLFNIPVICERGTYQGFISKSNLFTRYRDLLIEESKPLTAI